MGQDKTDSSEEVLSNTSNFTEPVNTQNVFATTTKEYEKKHVCKYGGCNAAYTRPSRLDRHMRMHTGERPYTCDHPGCDKAYTNTSHLKRHTATHNLIKKKLQCSKCFLTISNFHNLKRHYTRVHNNTVLTCNECNTTFNKKHQLIKHMVVHFGPTSYKCSKCNKMYINIKRLRRHEATHEKGDKRYPCRELQCSEVFDKWALLCKHKKMQHKDYKCDQCGKEFKRKEWLKSHSKTHAENRPLIPCPYDKCNRKYIFESNLKHHIKIYHLDQKFVCDTCKAGLSSKQKLIEHIMRIHEGKRMVPKRERSERKKRKDAGIPRKSMVTTLTGLKFVYHADKELLNRKSDIQPILEDDLFKDPS